MDLNGKMDNFTNSIVDWLPSFLGFIVVLVVGFVIAKILRTITVAALRRLGLDTRLSESPVRIITQKLTKSPTRAVGKLVFWLAAIVTVTVAISVLNLPVLNQFITGIYDYVPNIFAAVLILAVAMTVSTVISAIITKLMGDTITGKIVATVLPIVILSVAGFAILEQLKIAPTIVTITYTALVGSLGLGLALAFGLGGVDVSRRLFEVAYKKGKENIDQVKDDLEIGRKRVKEKAREAMQRAEDKKRPHKSSLFTDLS